MSEYKKDFLVLKIVSWEAIGFCLDHN